MSIWIQESAGFEDEGNLDRINRINMDFSNRGKVFLMPPIP